MWKNNDRKHSKNNRWENSAYGRLSRALKALHRVLCVGGISERKKTTRKKSRTHTVDIYVHVVSDTPKLLEIEPKAE